MADVDWFLLGLLATSLEAVLYTLLHLSDLHRSAADPISNTDLVSALISDSARYREETPSVAPPDAIIVTGDLVQGLRVGDKGYPAALETQYVEAFDLLAKLSDRFLAGDRSRMVIIPGNHDVDWNMAHRGMKPASMDGRDVRALVESRNSPYRWCWDTRQLYEITDPGLYKRRFGYFGDTYERFYENASLVFPVDAQRAWNLFSLDNGRILVAAFNSCALNDCFSQYGEIPPEAISESHLALLNARGSPKLYVSVWHHNVHGPPERSDYMDQHTLQLMIDKGYRLGLHGHQHKSEAGPFSLCTAERQVMAVVSAGSLCAGPSDIPPGFQRQYNVIEIQDYTSARIHVRQAQLPGIFSQGIFPGLGNPSYAEVTWTPVSIGAFVNTGKGGGAAVGAMEEVERLIASAAYLEAANRIDVAGGALGVSGRRLKTEALFRGSEWRKLVEHLAPPESADELAKCVRARIELKEFAQAEDLLMAAVDQDGIPVALIKDLRAKVRAESAAAK